MKKFRNVVLVILAIALLATTLFFRITTISGTRNDKDSSSEVSEYVRTITNSDAHLLEKYLILETGGTDKTLTEMLYVGSVVLNTMEAGKFVSLEELINVTYGNDETVEHLMSLDNSPYNDPRFSNARKVVEDLLINNNRPIAKNIFYYARSEYADQFKEMYGDPVVETENFQFFAED